MTASNVKDIIAGQEEEKEYMGSSNKKEKQIENQGEKRQAADIKQGAKGINIHFISHYFMSHIELIALF